MTLDYSNFRGRRRAPNVRSFQRNAIVSSSLKTAWFVCANAFTTPTRAFSCSRLRYTTRNDEKPRKRYHPHESWRTTERLCGMSQAFNVACVENNSMPHCACARPLTRSPRPFPREPIRAKSVDTALVHHVRSFSLPLQFSRITPSFFLPLLSIFPSSFSVALSLSPKLNLSLFVLEADMLSCSVAASRDRKTFPVLAFLASIYKNLYTESTVLSISTDFPQKLENFPPVYFFSLPYDCFSSPIVYAPPDDSLVRCITYGECAICFAGQATRRLSLPSSLGTRSEPISM